MKTRRGNAIVPVYKSEPAPSPKAHCGDGKGTGEGHEGKVHESDAWDCFCKRSKLVFLCLKKTTEG